MYKSEWVFSLIHSWLLSFKVLKKKMENLKFQQNTYIAAMYYNGGKWYLFKIHIDVTLTDLKYQLTQVNSRLHLRDDRRVTDLEYRRMSVCSDGTILLTSMKLLNDDDVRTMFSIFARYMINGPIGLDTKLVRMLDKFCERSEKLNILYLFKHKNYISLNMSSKSSCSSTLIFPN
jgi:hypothetical protein